MFQPAPGEKAQDLSACYYMTFRSADTVCYFLYLQGVVASARLHLESRVAAVEARIPGLNYIVF